jgi:class 3 adenylate cyclase
VIFVEIKGLADLTHDDSTDAIGVLKSIVAMFDESALRMDIEKIRTVGDTYMATCGLSTPVFDHARRAVEFGRELHASVMRFNTEHNLELQLLIGISAGRVHADVSRQHGLVFHLYGGTVIQADHARDNCLPGQIVVTKPVMEKLNELYDFSPAQVSGGVPLWTTSAAEAQPDHD